MVNPIRTRSSLTMEAAPKKKKLKAIDERVGKATQKTRLASQNDASKAIAKRIVKEEAAAAQSKMMAASRRILGSKQAGVKAQKSAFLAQRAHMAQQLMAAKRAAAAEKMKKTALKSRADAKRKRAIKKVRGIYRT